MPEEHVLMAVKVLNKDCVSCDRLHISIDRDITFDGTEEFCHNYLYCTHYQHCLKIYNAGFEDGYDSYAPVEE